MEISLPHDLEAKLTHIADQQGRDPGSLVLEAVERMIDHQEWFHREVEAGLAQIERGETLSHEDVGLRMRKQIALKQQPS